MNAAVGAAAALITAAAVSVTCSVLSVSSVKLKLVALETLPATSVWRTRTILGPSTGVNEVVHVAPPLIEYSTVAPLSIPERDSAPTFVM